MMCVSAHADELPDAMLGYWGLAADDETEGLVREDYDGADITIEKDTYSGEDYSCVILHVEKLAANLYTVQSSCTMVESEDPPEFHTKEFELLKSGRLLITPVGS
jgi:hypothetical protein